MPEKPILFSASMIRAILVGQKTQTRRVIKLPHDNPLGAWEATEIGGAEMRTSKGETIPRQAAIWHTRTGDTLICPYGQPGDRLWVRETVRAWETHEGLDGVWYVADGSFRPIKNTPEAAEQWVKLNSYGGQKGAKVPAIHMPRWASRISLEITSIRVERLQDISEKDAKAEGVALDYDYERMRGGTWRGGYAALWESINGPGSWDENPWVWVVEFKRVEGGDA